MGKIVKYKDFSTGKIYNQDETIGKWADGSRMSAKEAYVTHNFPLEEIQEEIITDQEREEIFDFAKQIVLASCHGGIDIDQIAFCHKAIHQAKELYKLKDTI